MNRNSKGMILTHVRAIVALTALFFAAIAGCGMGSDASIHLNSKLSADLAFAGGAIVTNGAFTNVYVYPDPSAETWEQHMASLRPSDASDFSRASIDALADRMMEPGWPSYFSPLFQYHCGFSTDCGINPPQFFGSGVASQDCVNAALADALNGVLEWTTIRSLSNCHQAGMDPSTQVNLIFSPDIPIAKIGFPTANGPEMCANTPTRAWHAWGLNVPNFAALPTSALCAGTSTQFSRSMSHEVVEILSDPAGLGYGDFPNYENEAADLCENLPDGFTMVGPDSFGRYWSNADGNCQPRLDAPGGSQATTWILGEGSPLVRFTGSVHDQSFSVPTPRVDTVANLTEVQVVIQTGGDDLRGGSSPSDNADVTLNFAGGSTLTTNVNNGGNWDNGQTHSAVLNLPATPLKASDISGVTISTHFGGGLSGDNWNVDKVALVVSFANGSAVTVPPHPIVHQWLNASELPLVRFTGDVHDEQLSVPPVDVGDTGLALNLVISTGNDDLRGGSNPGDNCDVTVHFASAPDAVLTNVNQGQTWDGWTKHTVAIPLPAGGLQGGEVTGVDLHTGFGGGISGDNWNVERVQLFATIDPASLIHVAIVQPTTTEYAHSATLTPDYSATDDGGPGMAQVVASIDGSTTLAGQPIASGQPVPLLALDLGSHTFKVVATDVWGNSQSREVMFSIVVTAASIGVDVSQLVASGQIDAQQENPLLAKLDAAAAARARGDCNAAANIYGAFIHEVGAQSGKKIDASAAAILTADAQYLINHCP